MVLLDISARYFDCAGLKLHLDRVFVPAGRGRLLWDSVELPEYREVKPSDSNEYVLAPGAYKIRYAEYVEVPEKAVAFAFPRSSLLRMGATIYTAVWNPGSKGKGEGLLVVFNEHGLVIERGSQVAQLVFMPLDKATVFQYQGVFLGEDEREYEPLYVIPPELRKEVNARLRCREINLSDRLSSDILAEIAEYKITEGGRKTTRLRYEDFELLGSRLEPHTYFEETDLQTIKEVCRILRVGAVIHSNRSPPQVKKGDLVLIYDKNTGKHQLCIVVE